MNTILDNIAAYARERVAESKSYISADQMKELALKTPKGSFPFEQALAEDKMSFICECKKASPSKGIIAQEFDYLAIAKDYEAAGASCISVLTEPRWFLGRNEYLKEISQEVSIPCLRKDFVVDEYMIYEAKTLGAAACLLICAITPPETLRNYIEICDALGLTALVEAHEPEEIRMAVDCGARVIGVNNRNLKDFSVDFSNSLNLRSLVPGNILFVAESGVMGPQDVQVLSENGIQAVLVGEAMMRASDKAAFLKEMKNAAVYHTTGKECR